MQQLREHWGSRLSTRRALGESPPVLGLREDYHYRVFPREMTVPTELATRSVYLEISCGLLRERYGKRPGAASWEIQRRAQRDLESMRRSLDDDPVGRYHEVDEGYRHGDESGQGGDEARKERGAVNAPDTEQHQHKGSVGESEGVDNREPQEDHGSVRVGEHPVDLPEVTVRADEGAYREQVGRGRRSDQKR